MRKYIASLVHSQRLFLSPVVQDIGLENGLIFRNLRSTMRKNGNTTIHGRTLILVPYRREHVERYHEWMQSEDLLEKTASERLTLEQEYEMQQKWYNDTDKCTFIILSKSLWEKKRNEIESMVGDVNLFLNNTDDKTEAEIEVMVADPSSRGCGVGTEAIIAMMHYGCKSLGIKKFVAIIGNDNRGSINLFSKLGFVKTKETVVFNQSTFELEINDEKFCKRFASEILGFTTDSYPVL